MQINNEAEGQDSLLTDLMALQAEYTARLSAETMKYLRQLQGMAAPATPQTVVQPDAERLLTASAAPGDAATVELEIENKQRLHAVVSASITALVADSGVTWLPLPDIDPPMLIVAPDETGSLNMTIPIPAEVPPAIYRGAVVMPGFIAGGVPLELTVAKPRAQASTRGAKAKPPATTAKKPSSSKTTRSKASADKPASGS